MSPPRDPGRPTVPRVLPFVQRIAQRHEGLCCWHVVLADRNVQDAFVRTVVDELTARVEPPHGKAQVREWKKFLRKHEDCIALMSLLPKMTKTQRLKLAARAFDKPVACAS